MFNSWHQVETQTSLSSSYKTSIQCAKGVAYETPCYQGLAYSAEKHVCDYPDNVPYCDKQTESVVGFKCPAPHELPPNAVARRFLPFPRFPKPGDETAYIVVSFIE